METVPESVERKPKESKCASKKKLLSNVPSEVNYFGAQSAIITASPSDKALSTRREDKGRMSELRLQDFITNMKSPKDSKQK